MELYEDQDLSSTDATTIMIKDEQTVRVQVKDEEMKDTTSEIQNEDNETKNDEWMTLKTEQGQRSFEPTEKELVQNPFNDVEVKEEKSEVRDDKDEIQHSYLVPSNKVCEIKCGKTRA